MNRREDELSDYAKSLLAEKRASEAEQLLDSTRCNDECKRWLGSSPMYCVLEKDHDGNHQNGHRCQDGTYSLGVLTWKQAL